MRISIISWADATKPFGSYQRPYWLAEELAAAGHDITHFCPGPPAAAHSGIKYFQTKRSPKESAATGLARLLRNHVKLLEAQPDILYVHQLTNIGFLIPRTLRLFDTYLDAHGSDTMEQSAFGRPDIVATARLIEAANLSTAEGIVAASAELRDFIVQEYGVDSSTVHVVPNGVSKEGFARPWGGANWRKSLGLSDQDLLAIHAAPPGYTANDLSVDFLGEVVQQIMSKRLRIKTVLTGRTTSPDGIHPLGVVDDYYGLVDAADVALLPYPPRAICGGTRNKALDFLARGKAIVSTSEGMRGLGEIRDGVHYIRAETPRDFVDALQLLGGNPLLRATLGETAKEIAAQNFWSARAEQLLRIFGNKRSAT